MDFKPRVGIDLHVHSTASDGTLAPSEIISLASEIGLGAIAITDHDTIDGTLAALDCTPCPTLEFLTGVEISAEFPKEFPSVESCHILGYGFDPLDPELTEALTTLQAARRNRNPQIIRRLQANGFDITLHDVMDIKTESGQTGRPHIAQAMVDKGFVRSIDEAFEQYLGYGRPAYVSKYRLECDQALALIRRAGGVPVLAHPGLMPIDDPQQLEAFIQLLKSLGLIGLEVYYSEHDPEETALYADLARRHDLLMTGGSDFHGAIKPEISMGTGRGNMFVPIELYIGLRSAVERVAA